MVTCICLKKKHVMCSWPTLNKHKGLFRASSSPQAEPCMRTILQVALQIAEALAFLHSRCVVQCDFSGSALLDPLHDGLLPR
jgi:hypothetical protein